jgi:DNA-binding LacI/PurR family transcriptional regulator
MKVPRSSSSYTLRNHPNVTKPTSPLPIKASPDKRLQMADLARLAGVSTATVSRALNGSELISPQTRKRITELAKSLNYTINIGAKNLRSGQNKTIGVVIPSDPASQQQISDPFFLSILGSIADALTASGYDTLVSRVHADHLDAAAELYDSGRVRGLIVIGQWHHHDQLNQMAANRLPLVVWGAQLPGCLYCTVGGNNILGGQIAAEHLLAMGRHRILFVGDIGLPEVEQRYAGYLKAHKNRSITADANLCIKAPFTLDGGRSAIESALQQQLRFDAIFAASDVLAMSALGRLAEQGLNVPDDVAVVGYDDIALAAYTHPSLSTIRQPIAEAGPAMVEALLMLIGGTSAKSVALDTQFVSRESTHGRA